MIPEIGQFALIIALLLALLGIAMIVLTVATNRRRVAD